MSPTNRKWRSELDEQVLARQHKAEADAVAARLFEDHDDARLERERRELQAAFERDLELERGQMRSAARSSELNCAAAHAPEATAAPARAGGAGGLDGRCCESGGTGGTGGTGEGGAGDADGDGAGDGAGVSGDAGGGKVVDGGGVCAVGAVDASQIMVEAESAAAGEGTCMGGALTAPAHCHTAEEEEWDNNSTSTSADADVVDAVGGKNAPGCMCVIS